MVIGATGRLGGYLRRYWPTARGLWQTRGPAAGPDWLRVDPIANATGLADAAGEAVAILCLAGVVPGRGAQLEANAALAEAAVRAGYAAGVPVLVASSAAVYGAPANDRPLTETQALLPASPYGAAKQDMEARAAALARVLGVRATMLRIGNVAGADACLGGWRPGMELDRFDDGATPARSYIGPRTLARVLDALCARPDLPPVLNVAAPGTVQMGQLLDAAGLAWRPRPAPESAIRQVALDVSLLRGCVDIHANAGEAATLASEWKDSRRQP